MCLGCRVELGSLLWLPNRNITGVTVTRLARSRPESASQRWPLTSQWTVALLSPPCQWPFHRRVTTFFWSATGQTASPEEMESSLVIGNCIALTYDCQIISQFWRVLRAVWLLGYCPRDILWEYYSVTTHYHGRNHFKIMNWLIYIFHDEVHGSPNLLLL